GISTAITNLGLSDPRMFFDPLSGRWFAAEINTPGSSNSVLIGRSDTSDPTGTWKATSYVATTGFADFPTLGVDATGVYLGTLNFFSTSVTCTMTSMPKADLLLSTPSVANRTMKEQSGLQMGAILQGVTNSDPNPAHASVISANAFNLGRVNRTTITGSGAA